MVRLYDKNIGIEDLKGIRRGDVIVYPSSSLDFDNYLIVSNVNLETHEISGQIATTHVVNSISIEKIIEALDEIL